MKVKFLKSVVCAAGAIFAATCGAMSVERVVKPPRFTRGNTSILPVQPIDQAAWLSHPDIKDEVAYPQLPRIVRFRCEFTSDGTPLEFDVTGDERYYLTLDGAFVSRGPHRGTVENWMYQSYRVKLEPGKHVMEATVWRMPFRASPLAQLSYKLGFCLKAEGSYDAVLTTGKGAWKCGPITGGNAGPSRASRTSASPAARGVRATGSRFPAPASTTARRASGSSRPS